MAARRGKALLLEIHRDDPTGVYGGGQTQRDRRLAAPAIEDRHVGPQVWQEKAGVDLRTPGLDRPLN